MQNFRSRNGENRNIRQPAIGLVNKLYTYISTRLFDIGLLQARLKISVQARVQDKKQATASFSNVI